MYFIKSKMIHKDERGYIYNVLREGEWREINYVESEKGTARGGHYHKKTTECFFVVKGLIDVSIKNVNTGKEEKFQAKEKDVFVVEPFEIHKFLILEDSAWINILSLPIDELDKDMYKCDNLSIT